jgi:hypothetical protein
VVDVVSLVLIGGIDSLAVATKAFSGKGTSYLLNGAFALS